MHFLDFLRGKDALPSVSSPPIHFFGRDGGFALVGDGGGIGGVAAGVGILVGDGAVEGGAGVAAVGARIVFGPDVIGGAAGEKGHERDKEEEGCFGHGF